MPARRAASTIAAHGKHRAAPLGAPQRIVHSHDQPDKEGEHPRHAAGEVEVVGARLEHDGDQARLQQQPAQGPGGQSGGFAPFSRTEAADQRQHAGNRGQRVRHRYRHHEELAEHHQRGFVGKVDGAFGAEDVKLQSEEGQQTRKRRDEARHAKAVEELRIHPADQASRRQGHEDRQRRRPIVRTHSTPRIAEERPLTEPTDRSISPTISTQTMPREMMPTVEQSNSRFTRLRGDRNTGFSVWNTVQMIASPTTTGREPRSPDWTRSANAFNAPEIPLRSLSRSSRAVEKHWRVRRDVRNQSPSMTPWIR